MTSTHLDAALRYAARGWAVFPCHEPTAGRCSCGRPDCASPAKHPRTARGLQNATRDPDVIARWWQRWPTANVAVRTGVASGLVVLDIDPGHGGLQALADLERGRGNLPPGPVVHTGSGGRHHWFAHPGASVSTSAGRVGRGVDVRADGGYVVAPPSRHASGGRYCWISEGPIPPLPEWLLELCRQPERTAPLLRRCPEPVVGAGSWAKAALHGEISRVEGASIGSRNHTLNRAAFALGQLVGADCLPEDAVRDALRDAALRRGLTAREINATITSGLSAGVRSPRYPRQQLGWERS